MVADPGESMKLVALYCSRIELYMLSLGMIRKNVGVVCVMCCELSLLRVMAHTSTLF